MKAEPRNWDTDALPLVPVGRETVQERVYCELRRALIAGRFAPGQVLTLRGLADALMTSTMPVREALGRLITEQALEVMPNRTIRVPPVTADRIADLLRARVLIEGEAVALAAARIGVAEVTALHDMMAGWTGHCGTATPASVDAESALNQRFHFAIYRAAGSGVLLPMIESLWLQSGPCIRAAIFAFAGAGERDADRFHRAIIAALAAGDAQAARAALNADISRPFAYLRQTLTEPAGDAA